ncbi:glycosyltransferase [Natronomonas sp. CBA1123]|jgi:voltage-gated potassium channel Kch|uniref:glycosyltransferase n=1 Tax=Natronomonas sp. CBA1123 TaxID=2668070 RepID=UPI0012E9A915|nr:glycosyltransferase family 2 protein [Natronomonas sp. CBA1123]MUV87065.1 glycosyltransferase [Natronomonas sp. CBA1123]
MLPSPRRVSELAGTVCGIGGLLVLGIVFGVELVTITIESLSVTFDFFGGAVSVFIATAIMVVGGAFVVRDVWRDPDADEKVLSGPDVCAIVPAYNDAEIVEVSVESLLDSEYDSLSVAVVTEPDDPRTRAKAQDLAEEHESVTCLVNGNPGSKAGAINYAVEWSDADHFTVFDADERVSPEFVPLAMTELLGDADVFQGRRIPRPNGVVETLAYCERIAVQTGYALGELGGFTHCQSSSTAFTREAFETVGGYDDKLTEDIDFSHKVYRADLTVRQNRRCTTTMEAPHTLRDLWGQRKRWRIGHVEVADARAREALDGDLGFSDLLSIGRAAGSMVAGALMLIVVAQVPFLVAQDVESAFLVPYGLVLAIVGSVWLKDVLEGRVVRPTWAVSLVPLVYLGHGVLTVKAFLEYYLTWDGEWYQVTKTEA